MSNKSHPWMNVTYLYAGQSVQASFDVARNDDSAILGDTKNPMSGKVSKCLGGEAVVSRVKVKLPLIIIYLSLSLPRTYTTP